MKKAYTTNIMTRELPPQLPSGAAVAYAELFTY